MDALWRLRGTTVALVGIWLAVPLVGVFGGDIVTETGNAGGKGRTRSEVPAVVPVAALAVAATFFVTWFAYRSEKARAPDARRGAERPIREPESTPAPQDGPVAVGHR